MIINQHLKTRHDMNTKKYYLSALLLLLGVALMAQDAGTTQGTGTMASALNYLILALIGAVVFTAFGAIVYVNNMILQRQKIELMHEYGLEAVEKVGLSPQESWWQQQYKKWTNAVPIEREADVMLDHDYDGIKELDNSLPPWWVAMFYFSIAFSPIYIYYSHFSDYGKSSAEQYAMEMEVAEKEKKRLLKLQANKVNEENVEALVGEEALAMGERLFKGSCSACHGQLGEGGIGPNLTDDYWLHGGSIKDIFKAVKYGFPEKGMIAWQTQIPPAEMQKVASFIMQLHGTNPPNAKEPQGELYKAVKEQSRDSLSQAAIGMK